MNKQPEIGGKDAVFCVACGDILSNGSEYNLCFDCWSDVRYELEEEWMDTQNFVPTNAPLSCSCKHDQT